MKYSIRERIHEASYWTQQHSHEEGSCLLAKTKCALTICKTSIQEDPYKYIYYNRTTNVCALQPMPPSIRLENYLCNSSFEGGRNKSFLCEKRDLTLFSKSWSASCMAYSQVFQSSSQIPSCSIDLLVLSKHISP